MNTVKIQIMLSEHDAYLLLHLVKHLADQLEAHTPNRINPWQQLADQLQLCIETSYGSQATACSLNDGPDRLPYRSLGHKS